MRVVVLDFNGGELTLRCLRSLRATEWPRHRLDVVLVDNGSTLDILTTVQAQHPEVRIVRAGTNLGFAGGCNLGLGTWGGDDYVALVNNDAEVEPGWLAPLVEALEADPSLGAASPKILFAPTFVDVFLSRLLWDRATTGRQRPSVRISGLRAGGVDRWRAAQFLSSCASVEHRPDGGRSYLWSGAAAQLRVPISAGEAVPAGVEVRISADRPTSVDLCSSNGRIDATVDRRARWIGLPLGGNPYNVINNVGTVLVEHDYGADRGYLEADLGQYDEPEDVFAWSGAAVVLARRYLDDVGLFDPRFFLYYEDLDLAWRGRKRGWRYRYVPTSVVRHVHSATTDEGSDLFRFYNERNRLLLLARNEGLRRVATAVGRYLLSTASYARRDIVWPVLDRRPPRPRVVGVRLAALVSFLRLLGSPSARRPPRTPTG